MDRQTVQEPKPSPTFPGAYPAGSQTDFTGPWTGYSGSSQAAVGTLRARLSVGGPQQAQAGPRNFNLGVRVLLIRWSATSVTPKG